MGVVKYTGPVASFHCPTNAEIRSLKVHFSPKQEGTGDPSPENVREIVGWDGVVVHNDDGIVVPNEYQKVEYLESDGKQYLNTEINGASGLNIECILMLNSNANISNCGMVGSRENGDATRFYAISFFQNKWHIGMPNDSVFREVLIQVKYKVRLETTVNKCTLYVNDEVYANVNSYQDTNYPLYVFACNNYGTAARFCSGRLYNLSIYNGLTKQLNYIPCRRKSDNKPGMYDTVSGEFFTNQGTGEFICGPDVGETVSYEFGVLGKNKFDKSQSVDGRITKINGTNYTAESGYYISSFIPVVVGASYTKNSPIVDAYHRFATYSSNNVDSFVRVLDTSNTITIEPGENYIRFCGEITELDTAQLELGSTATSYEPYNPNKTVYGGWVDLISGEVQEEGINDYPYEFISLNGTENWILVKQDEQTTIFKYYYSIGAKSEGNSICSHFMLRLPSYNMLDIPNAFVHGMSGNLFIQTDNSLASTVEEFTSYLQEQYQNNTPVSILFQANRSNKTYTLSPYSQELKTFLGQNNIWSNADYVEVEYDLHETQEILNRKAFIMANQPHLVVPEAAQLQSFTTDLAAPLKECKAYFKPKQEGEGDPSPENICPIEGWESIEVTTAGNNIIPINYTPAEGKWKPTNGVISGSVYDMGQFFVPKSKLYWSCETKGMTYIGLMDDSITTGAPTYNVITTTNREGYTLDNTEGHKYMLMCCNAENIINLKQMVNIGTTKTEYSAPSARTIPITFPTEAGTIYGGYVDLVRGEVWQTHRVFDCADYLSTTTDIEMVNGNLCRLRTTKFYDGLFSDLITEKFKTVTQSWAQMTTLAGENAAVGSGYLGFSSSSFGYTTKAEWLSYLTENHIKFCVAISTPQLVATLTPQVLKTLRGTNNIWSSANDNIEIKYWKH